MLVVFENKVLHNLTRTAEACGGIERLMPHVKTHRAPWVVKLPMASAMISGSMTPSDGGALFTLCPGSGLSQFAKASVPIS
jgi:hypothetical protein